MNSKPSPMRADAKRNYDHLLETAATAFSVDGAAATLEHIAKSAGVGIGTLYRHFPTRRSLLEAVYADKITSLISGVPALLRSLAPDKALAAWLKSVVEYSQKYGGFSSLVEMMTAEKHSPLLAAGSELLKKAQDGGVLRPDVSIKDIMQLINGLMVDSSPEEIERSKKLLDVIISGLKR